MKDAGREAHRYRKARTMFFIAAGLAAFCVMLFGQSKPTSRTVPRMATAADKSISSNAQQMIDQGRQIFRFDTFGSEAFWGDALQLHKAIAGDKHGGVGAGVSPKTALAVGLKVDV